MRNLVRKLNQTENRIWSWIGNWILTHPYLFTLLLGVYLLANLWGFIVPMRRQAIEHFREYGTETDLQKVDEEITPDDIRQLNDNEVVAQSLQASLFFRRTASYWIIGVVVFCFALAMCLNRWAKRLKTKTDSRILN